MNPTADIDRLVEHFETRQSERVTGLCLDAGMEICPCGQHSATWLALDHPSDGPGAYRVVWNDHRGPAPVAKDAPPWAVGRFTFQPEACVGVWFDLVCTRTPEGALVLEAVMEWEG